jgi:hypothetical protein
VIEETMFLNVVVGNKADLERLLSPKFQLKIMLGQNFYQISIRSYGLASVSWEEVSLPL